MPFDLIFFYKIIKVFCKKKQNKSEVFIETYKTYIPTHTPLLLYFFTP